jgi:5-methylcytosine-specific restriction endonuclease McrA
MYIRFYLRRTIGEHNQCGCNSRSCIIMQALYMRYTHMMHGIRGTYTNRGCRCPACRAANTTWREDWKRRNPEKGKAMQAAKMAARKFGEHVHWSVFLDIHSQPCYSCGATPSGEADHIIPFAAGGRNIISNLQPACHTCNMKKGAKLI